MNNNYDSSIDYFAVLGVHYGACDKTIKMMYRKMARRYHPDVSTIHDAQKKFQEIAFAYEVLKKHRKEYCFEYERFLKNKANKSRNTHASQQSYSSYSRTQQKQKPSSKEDSYNYYSNRAYRAHRPVHGKDRLITYPLTLRYAIRLLKLGVFYIPGLKVKMKFTRVAFEGKTFRLKGKGYRGLFGGKSGDYLVRFSIKFDCTRFQLKGGDIYGTFFIPQALIQGGKKIKLESPSGSLDVNIPLTYRPDQFICIKGMGLPADKTTPVGDFYVCLRKL